MQPRATTSLFATPRADLPAGVVVFLVALPLCLGIALACNAPLLSGIVAGAVGGIVVPLVSRSALSVCGPAAGLTAVILAALTTLGSFEAVLTATMLAGVLQIGIGLLRAGSLASLVPGSVIKGMLAAIGIILILKQLPHVVGYDPSDLGLAETGPSVLRRLVEMFDGIQPGALAISAVSLGTLWGWPRLGVPGVPSALLVVVFGTLLQVLFEHAVPQLALDRTHLVALPELAGPVELWQSLSRPDFSVLSRLEVYEVAITLAIVASIETLLSIEAVDRLDPERRKTPTSRELFAQGIANIVSGGVGGLPITSVIVRSSANVASGAKNRLSALTHGVLLLASVLILTPWLNHIPLACLAAILLQTGYKLATPELIASMWRLGPAQFAPFAVTVVAILATDLLRGVLAGLVLGVLFAVRANAKSSIETERKGDELRIVLRKDATFLVKPAITDAFARARTGDVVTIDAKHEFVDHDARELILAFKEDAASRDIEVKLRGDALEQTWLPCERAVERGASATASGTGGAKSRSGVDCGGTNGGRTSRRRGGPTTTSP
jgi:MFS superfamily sulfate permease-like transporter